MKVSVVLLIILFFSFQAESSLLKGKYELTSSQISYLVTYLIKKADGTSTLSKGKGECHEKCEFLVAVPVKSFVSRDSNRDANMLLVTKAESYPLAIARIVSTGEVKDSSLICDMEIEFGGMKNIYKAVPFNLTPKGNDFLVQGSFDLILSQHNINRPSLLGVKIKDIVPVTISAEWKKL